nr:MAG TPA: hypothetical protein [Bacteriophage sp.]
MAFNITLNKKLNVIDKAELSHKINTDTAFRQELISKGVIRDERIDEDEGLSTQPIAAKRTNWVSSYTYCQLIADAIKRENPGMANVDFTNFSFIRSEESKVGSKHESGTPKGTKISPVIEMNVSKNPEIARLYNEDSKLLKFNLDAPNINDVISEAITIENISELTWDDYSKVTSVLEQFVNNDRGMQVKTVEENENSKYVHLVYNGQDSNLNPSTFFSVDLDWNSDLWGIPVLSFHFTRAEVENKETIVLENSNIRMSKDPLLTTNP